MLSCKHINRCVLRHIIALPQAALYALLASLSCAAAASAQPPRSVDDETTQNLEAISPTEALGRTALESTGSSSSGQAGESDFRSTIDEPSLEKLREQIQHLNSPSYRSRQLAIWYLEQNAARALPLLREAGRTTDLNIGAEVVSLLSSQAMRADASISVAAHEALKDIAGGKRSVTAVSFLANSALDGIAARQELLAQRSLEDLRVGLGQLRLTIGGIMQNEGRMFNLSNIIHVTDDFLGTEKDVRLFRFLRSYDTAYLEGEKISEPLLREVLSMPGLKRIVLKGPSIDNAILSVLFDIPTLEHLELVYANVDDSAVDTIVDLPLVDSLRVFGTNISTEGASRIKKELDGLDIYFGRGGFLGVQTSQNDLLVSKIVVGSGAERGGIEPYDFITHINDKPIKTFSQLREELANFAANEMVTVTVKRASAISPQPLERLRAEDSEALEFTFQIMLGKQETPP